MEEHIFFIPFQREREREDRDKDGGQNGNFAEG